MGYHPLEGSSIKLILYLDMFLKETKELERQLKELIKQSVWDVENVHWLQSNQQYKGKVSLLFDDVLDELVMYFY